MAKPSREDPAISGHIANVGVCGWCNSSKPGKRGFRIVTYPAFRAFPPRVACFHVVRYDCHWNPLRCLFWAAKFDDVGGMNWLQDRGKVSDNCIDPKDVALDDIEAVFTEAAFAFNSEWLKSILKKHSEDA